MAFSLIVLLLGTALPVYANADANSPSTNYRIYLRVDEVDIFDKPNGKKIATVEQYVDDADGPADFNRFIVNSFVKDNYWAKVTVTKVDGKKITGYVRTKFIMPNLHALDYVIVNHTAGLTLKSQPNAKSKGIITIPYGTRVDINYDKELTEAWYYVTYVVKGKKYKGYLPSKYLQ